MATERPAKAKRILVVEDEPMIRMLLEDMLGELGYTVAAEAAGIRGQGDDAYRAGSAGGAPGEVLPSASGINLRPDRSR